MYKMSVIVLIATQLIACGGGGGGSGSTPEPRKLTESERWGCVDPIADVSEQDQYGIAVKNEELWNYSAKLTSPVKLVDAVNGEQLRQRASTDNVLSHNTFDFQGYTYFTASQYGIASGGDLLYVFNETSEKAHRVATIKNSSFNSDEYESQITIQRFPIIYNNELYAVSGGEELYKIQGCNAELMGSFEGNGNVSVSLTNDGFYLDKGIDEDSRVSFFSDGVLKKVGFNTDLNQTGLEISGNMVALYEYLGSEIEVYRINNTVAELISRFSVEGEIIRVSDIGVSDAFSVVILVDVEGLGYDYYGYNSLSGQFEKLDAKPVGYKNPYNETANSFFDGMDYYSSEIHSEGGQYYHYSGQDSNKFFEIKENELVDLTSTELEFALNTGYKTLTINKNYLVIFDTISEKKGDDHFNTPVQLLIKKYHINSKELSEAIEVNLDLPGGTDSPTYSYSSFFLSDSEIYFTINTNSWRESKPENINAFKINLDTGISTIWKED